MNREKPEDIRMAARYCTSKYEYKSDPKRWEHYAEREIRERLAGLIEHERSEIHETEDMIEKRLDLYVATPETFWRIVKAEADKIALRFYGR